MKESTSLSYLRVRYHGLDFDWVCGDCKKAKNIIRQKQKEEKWKKQKQQQKEWIKERDKILRGSI